MLHATKTWSHQICFLRWEPLVSPATFLCCLVYINWGVQHFAEDQELHLPSPEACAAQPLAISTAHVHCHAASFVRFLVIDAPVTVFAAVSCKFYCCQDQHANALLLFTNALAYLPMGPSVASNEKIASLNCFFRFSDRHSASLTASRNSSANSTPNCQASNKIPRCSLYGESPIS